MVFSKKKNAGMIKIVIDARMWGESGVGRYIRNLVGSLQELDKKNEYFLILLEKDFRELGRVLQNAAMIIGFSINRFDLPVLAKYFNFNVLALPRLDLLEELELNYGSRVGLDILVKTNLNLAKTHHGLDAVRFYAEGNFKELEDYCLQDVKVTKELYDFVKKNKYLMVPKKFTGELVKVNLNLREIEIPATLF